MYATASIRVTPVDQLEPSYAFVNKVNRIFGDDAPGAFGRFDCECHFINGQYKALLQLELEAYGYLADMDNAPANSTDTFGIRAWGAYRLNEVWKLVYATDGNPTNIEADYYLGELGLSVKLDNPLFKTMTVKFNYEVLEGDGTRAFITPLSTAHAFQDWANRFVTTPRDGIEDFYVTAIADGVFGGKFIFSWHKLESDNMDYDYDADRNTTALVRAGGPQTNDVTKVWV